MVTPSGAALTKILLDQPILLFPSFFLETRLHGKSCTSAETDGAQLASHQRKRKGRTRCPAILE